MVIPCARRDRMRPGPRLRVCAATASGRSTGAAEVRLAPDADEPRRAALPGARPDRSTGHGAALYVTTKSMLSLLFVGLSPLLMVANYVDQRLATRRAHVRGSRPTERRWSGSGRRSSAAAIVSGPCSRTCTRRSRAAWRVSFRPRSRSGHGGPSTRSSSGSGSAPGRFPDGRVGGTRCPPGECVAEARGLIARSRAPKAPITVTPRGRSGGRVRRRPVLDGVLRGLVLQMAALHPRPRSFSRALTNAQRADLWSWLSWLPHTLVPALAARRSSRRRRGRGPCGSGPARGSGLDAIRRRRSVRLGPLRDDRVADTPGPAPGRRRGRR